ncbi:MAG: T9SS type A sorting domain-containing protein [Crocinitomicaceae bacterium]|nr:T9SS type A sorting domain-containing protein [Crocinitomicaceae bacterium]
MKLLLRFLTLNALLLFAVSAFTQGQHYDNKPYIEGEFLVQVKSGEDIRNLIRKAPANYEMSIAEYLSPPMRVWLVKFNHHNVEHWQFQNWLYEQKEVSIADYNYLVEMRSTLPNDASFTQQWHHNNTGQTGGTPDADIDSDLAWDITTGGLTATNDDIVVCMVEGGGGNLNHQDLSPNRWINTNEIDGNGIDDDGNGYVDDYYGWNTGTNDDNTGTGGHGTNCLGMIGAKGNNGLNVVGANWDVKLMVLNMGGGLSQSNVIAAYTYPLVMRQMWNNTGGTQGAFVVATSASWGIDGADPASYPLWCAFYDTLGYHGILNVGATTNQNLDVDVAGDMPTACASPYMIGVGRTDHNDNTAGGYGDQTIEFGAPGINVVTTANTNTITTTTGTSFSCPLTAGVIGLAYSIPCPNLMSLAVSNPQGAADVVLQALLDGTDPKSQLSTKFITGGRLNSRNTLDELMLATCTGSLCLSPSAVTTTNINDMDADINFTAYDSADQTIIYWQESGTGSWNVVTSATSPYDLNGLTGCTDYEYYLVSVCGTDTSSATATQTFSTTGCGNCIDLNYCASQATDGVDEWIDNFNIDTYTNNSGNDGGYGDYTGASVISLIPGQTYPITVTPAWSGTLYDEYSRIWIDVNQNGTFEPAELLYDQGTATQTPATGNVTIPGGAVLGSTRMRVQLAYQGPGQTALPDVCASFTWGEVEDYCVDIISACTFNVTETLVDPSCNGNADGSISLNVTGAQPPYTYLWNPGGSTSSSITGLSGGTYTVTITDNTGLCDTTISYTLNEPAALSASTAITDVTCNGNADGAIDLTVTGGTTPYTYSWSTGATTEDISGLSGGSYDVTITDDNGCSITLTGNVVNEPATLTGTLNITDGTCTVPGSATISASGGTSPYTYSWSTGDTGTSVTGLPAGPISVTITDDNGCTVTESGTVNLAGAASITLNSATDVSCNGMTDGAINVDITGGTTPYTFSWSNGASTEDITNVGAGTYTLTLTDDAGCTTVFTHTINEPPALTATLTIIDGQCGGNGDAQVAVSGGANPYTYSWSTGGTGPFVSNLSAGPISVTVTDNNGCTVTESGTVTNNPDVSVSLTSSTDASCNAGNDGAIDVTVSGGTGPFTYSWSNGATTEDLSGVGAGTYTLTVTDDLGCTATLTETINEPTAISGSATTTDIISGSDGSVDLTVTGGTPPYTYNWTSGETTEDLSGLSLAGTYTCTITDANGCTTTVNAIVNSQLSIIEEGLKYMNIYPNPSHGTINILFTEKILVDITIYNSMGQSLFTLSNNGDQSIAIDMNEFASGVYILNVKAEDGTEVNRRVMIKR